MADYISPRCGPYHSDLPLGYGFVRLGLNVNLPGWHKMRRKDDRVNGRLSLGWPVVSWVGRSGVLVLGVAEGGKECVGGGVSDML